VLSRAVVAQPYVKLDLIPNANVDPCDYASGPDTTPNVYTSKRTSLPLQSPIRLPTCPVASAPRMHWRARTDARRRVLLRGDELVFSEKPTAEGRLQVSPVCGRARHTQSMGTAQGHAVLRHAARVSLRSAHVQQWPMSHARSLSVAFIRSLVCSRFQPAVNKERASGVSVGGRRGRGCRACAHVGYR